MMPTNRERLLKLYNEIYDKEEIPDHFSEALVVQIYKPGKIPEHFASYRTIALLNITYKIYAKMLQERLRNILDHRIVEFQFGYRQGKSTAEPIFIARRTQEFAERHGNTLYMLALDYSKAFDSIPHVKLSESLLRYGVPKKLITLVDCIYKHPRFRIKLPEGISTEKTQDVGIRQGCPLSPYLYIIATSCLMEDLLVDFRKEYNSTPMGAAHPFLLFSDDTLLLTDTSEQMTILLALTIEHSQPYNLYLTKEKCQLLVTNDNYKEVLFPDGSPVKKQASIKYLGTIFSATLDVYMITKQRIMEASQTMHLLTPLRKDNQIPTAWKLVVFNAIIRSRIFYTLETVELTPSHQRTLDTLYYRGLRKILHKPATYIDRTSTHERLLNLANATARRVSRTATKHQPFSQYYLQRRRKLLGHLLRAPEMNICRQAVLSREDADLTTQYRKKRVGRPRYTWLQESLREAWEELTNEEQITEETIPTLKELALRRTAPFNI